jgi:hypothetical protein
MPAILTDELGRKSSEVAVSATLSRYRLYLPSSSPSGDEAGGLTLFDKRSGVDRGKRIITRRFL